MAATPLGPPALARLAAGEPGGGAPAHLLARFARGALEPRRPHGGLERRPTLEGP
jgi:hypothetical protein